MRVIVLGPTYPYRGGISHYTSALARSLAYYAHDVSVVSFKRQYPQWLYPGRIDHDQELRQGSPRTHFMLDPLTPQSWCKTARFITGMAPDIVLVQWWNTFWAPAFAAVGFLLRQRGIRQIYQVHNVLPHEPHAGDVQLTRMALRWANGFITWTSRDLERLRPYIRKVPVELCPMPVYGLPTETAYSREEARSLLGITGDVPIVLFFGYIRPYKGLKVLLTAISALRQAHKPVYLIVAGQFWDCKKEYTELIAQLGLSNTVRLEDRYIPDKEVGAYFIGSDVLVAPYIGDAQSSVVSLGLRFGIPLVITSQLESRMVTKPENLCVIPEGDSHALAEAIRQLSSAVARQTTPAQPSETGWRSMVQMIEKLSTVSSVNS